MARALLREPKAVTWVFVATGIVCILANAPLIYGLIFVHGRSIGALWGYAPNQFLFPTLFLPFAAVTGWHALRLWILQASSELPLDNFIRLTMRSWPVFLLCATVIAGIVSIIIFLGSSWSFDKLRYEHATRAIACAQEFELSVAKSSISSDEREQFRLLKIQDAKHALAGADIPEYQETHSVSKWLEERDCSEFLQVVQSGRLQRSLDILHPVMHAMAVIQLFVIICSAFITVAVSALAAATEFRLRGLGLSGHLESVIAPLQFSILFFSAFALLYAQHRREIESLVGGGTTVLQDLFVALIGIGLLALLGYLQTESGAFSFSELLKFLPAVLLTAGTAGSLLGGDLFRRLIGSGSNAGVQALLFVAVGLLGTIWTAALLAKN